MARIATLVLLVTVNTVLSSQSAEIFQSESSEIALSQRYYPNDKINLVTLGLINGKKYFFAHRVATWYEASYFCNAHGMDLASIRTQHENKLIMEQLSHIGLSGSAFWISGHTIGRSMWLWINGDFILFNDWEIGEPNSETYHHCIYIWNSKWHDGNCAYGTSNGGFICEERDTIEGSADENRSIYPDDLLNMVTLDPTTGKQYLFANTSADWFEANYFCNAYGMDLVTIESQMENDLIMAHIESIEMTEIMVFWTSAHKIGRSTWFWINGENMTFSDWATGQPDRTDVKQCMYIYGGKWFSYYCYASNILPSAAFICESREKVPNNSTDITKYYPTDMMNLVTLGPGNGTKYLFSNATLASWFEASYFCNVHGMDLVSIETPEENDALKEHLVVLGNITDYWASGHKIGRASYLWIKGEYMLYTDWAPGEPFDNSFDCMHLHYDGWFDADCIGVKSYICEERNI